MPRYINANKLRKDVLGMPNCYNGFSDTYDKAMIVDLIDEQPTVDAEPKWIPITSRPIDDEERIKWAEEVGLVLENDEALIYTSQLPDDGEEVLTCSLCGTIRIDIFYNDPDYGCYFEDNGDMDGIVAWMPLPKPYRERREDE